MRRVVMKKWLLLDYSAHTKRVSHIDQATGEVLGESVTVLIDPENQYIADKNKRRRRHHFDYVQVFDSVRKAIATKELTPMELAVLSACINFLDWESPVVTNPETG